MLPMDKADVNLIKKKCQSFVSIKKLREHTYLKDVFIQLSDQ